MRPHSGVAGGERRPSPEQKLGVLWSVSRQTVFGQPHWIFRKSLSAWPGETRTMHVSRKQKQQLFWQLIEMKQKMDISGTPRSNPVAGQQGRLDSKKMDNYKLLGALEVFSGFTVPEQKVIVAKYLLH